MKSSAELKSLQAKIKVGYVLWMISILSVIAVSYFYRRGDPEAIVNSEATERAEIARYRDQIDVLNAELLRNQRALKSAERDILQLDRTYANAMEEIKRLQSRP